jgi:hypothetical protein
MSLRQMLGEGPRFIPQIAEDLLRLEHQVSLTLGKRTHLAAPHDPPDDDRDVDPDADQGRDDGYDVHRRRVSQRRAQLHDFWP